MNKINNVALIGAGIAGLSCATALENAGFQVTLFEKSRGVSGRLSTRTAQDWQCDHGAQYFTARDPLFYAEVERWVANDVAQLWQPTLKVFDGKAFTPKQSETKTARYVGYPKNNSPATFLAKTLHVMTETTVTALYQNAARWQVNSKEHGLYSEYFDHVILAIPAPQAATLLKNTQANFHNICSSVMMRPCFALMVNFDETIPCAFDGLFINDGMLTWAARDSAKPGRQQQFNIKETWVLHAQAQWSALHVDDEKEIVAQHILAEFNRILQMDDAIKNAHFTFAAPKNHTLHRWLYADCESYLTDTYHYDIDQKIGMCGDWLNGGKVEGAWLSGLQLARKIIEENNVVSEVDFKRT